MTTFSITRTDTYYVEFEAEDIKEANAMIKSGLLNKVIR